MQNLSLIRNHILIAKKQNVVEIANERTFIFKNEKKKNEKKIYETKHQKKKRKKNKNQNMKIKKIANAKF